MLHLTELSRSPGRWDVTLTLIYDARNKSRFRATLDDGREAFVRLPRGSSLRDGDVLSGPEARVLVCAAPEPVSVATASDPLLLARAAYHLGNRHVPLEIGPGRVVYQHDHVLDHMVSDLGLEVTSARLPFQPESGAYDHGEHPVHAAEHRH
jgi:urease accessory protein